MADPDLDDPIAQSHIDFDPAAYVLLEQALESACAAWGEDGARAVIEEILARLD